MKDYNKLSRQAYNKAAREYSDSREGRFTYSFKRELVNMVAVDGGGAVLDVACGTGDLLYMLSRKAKARFFGIDIAEEMIAEANKRYPGIDFCVGESAKLDFPDNYFDVITVSAAFHHFPDPGRFLREAARTLKMGGTLYIADIFAPAVVRQIFNFVLLFSKSGDKKIYSAREMVRLCNDAGMKDVEIIIIDNIQITRANKI